MKAENLLKKSGMAIMLIPAPRALSTDCGLAIRFDDELFDNIMQLLESEHLLPATVFRKESDTYYQHIWENSSSDIPAG